MVYLIPAYEPGGTLPALVRSLRNADPFAAVVVVDDGSGPDFAETFRATAGMGATVIRHAANCGKGAALKTGFSYIARRDPGHPVVCADADGQHLVADIVAVGHRVRGTRQTQVLGVRSFGPEVPLRSRFGNKLTGLLFRATSGHRIGDTQTGLRGFSADLMPWLQSVGGDRYEYELNLLLHARSAGVLLDTLPIRTVYLDGNSSSHFRPVVDSVRIYRPLLRFALSSLFAFGVDLVALLVLQVLTGSLLASVIGARLISSTTNFLVNRFVVFRDADRADGSRSRLLVSAVRYFALAGGILLANYALLRALTGLGVQLVVAKIATELLLFGVSFLVQRSLVFRGRGRTGTAEPAANLVALDAGARSSVG